ncbi:hypothetical protein [Ancylobacter sp. G4_0304]|uniref:hypothetical protein n=1 Tax=Ancylobacter sp. G4_0304 TaxID=3114289 RepID=UPI0039C6CAFF
MPSPFVRLDPETVRLLDACMTRTEKVAAPLTSGSNAQDTRTRLASALIEAIRLGERDEDRLVEFALRVLPAYREGRMRPPA